MICPNCGNEVGNAKFCTNCGTKTETIHNPDTENSSFQQEQPFFGQEPAQAQYQPELRQQKNLQNSRENQTQTASNQPFEQSSQFNVQYQPTETDASPSPVVNPATVQQFSATAPIRQNSDKKSKGAKIVIVAAIVIILLIAGIIGTKILNGSNPSDNPASVSTSTTFKTRSVPEGCTVDNFADTREKSSVSTTTKTENKTTATSASKATTSDTKKPENDSQKKAVSEAKAIIDENGSSRVMLINTLKQKGFSQSDSEYAVDSLNLDWQKQAARTAEEYLSEGNHCSRTELIEKLIFESYTNEQAEKGVDSLKVDWNEQAAAIALNMLQGDTNRESIIEDLEAQGFTHDQAVYGADHAQ